MNWNIMNFFANYLIVKYLSCISVYFYKYNDKYFHMFNCFLFFLKIFILEKIKNIIIVLKGKH